MKNKNDKFAYNGIVFDSAYEALFARVLTLTRNEWVYRPYPHCDHSWNFLVFPMHSEQYKWDIWLGGVGGKRYTSKGSVYRPSGNPVLVDYQPTMPSNSYVDFLTEKMSKDPKESIVVWGNPWDGPNPELKDFSESCYYAYPIFTKHGKFGWGDFIRLADNGYDMPVSYRHNVNDMLDIGSSDIECALDFFSSRGFV